MHTIDIKGLKLRLKQKSSLKLKLKLNLRLRKSLKLNQKFKLIKRKNQKMKSLTPLNTPMTDNKLFSTSLTLLETEQSIIKNGSNLWDYPLFTLNRLLSESKDMVGKPLINLTEPICNLSIPFFHWPKKKLMSIKFLTISLHKNKTFMSLTKNIVLGLE